MSLIDTNEIDNELRGVESKLEEIGRKVCDVKGSAPTWNAINKAIEYVQDAIHSTFTMNQE